MQPNQWSSLGTSQNHLPPSPGRVKRKGLVLHQHCRILTKICCREHMFPSSLQIYLCLVHIKTSSKSLEILSMKHGRIFPTPTPHPLFSCYNTSPHRKIINRWVGWERLPARTARYLGKQASLLWFPGWREEDRPQLDCPSHWVELEKPDRNHRYLSLSSPNYQLHTPFHKSGHTNRGTESKMTISTQKPSGRISCSVLCIMGGFETRNSPWLGSIVVWEELCSQLDNLGQ